MAKHFLTDEIIEHIQDGYYATHEQDLTEDQIHELSEEQLRYYTRQGKEYQAEQKKKRRVIIWVLAAASIFVVAAIAILFISLNSGNDLYDPNKQSEAATGASDSSNLLGTPPSNTKAGAKNNAAQ